MRYWRKRDSDRTAAQERQRAQRYYQRHRDEILAKARLRRRRTKPSETMRSH